MVAWVRRDVKDRNAHAVHTLVEPGHVTNAGDGLGVA
jgi:hypothetical protein